MNIPVSILILLTSITGMVFFLESAKRRSTRDAAADNAWEAALATEGSQVGRILLRVSRPMANIPQIYNAPASGAYRALYNKILASGSFGGFLEVFLAVQSMAAFVGATTLALVIANGGRDLPSFAGALLGLGIAAYPYNIVAKKSKERIESVEAELPIFAELVLMPLEAGLTPLAAMSFTANKLDGPVAQEIRNLQTLINSRSISETEAFQLSAARLGTPEASQFMTALMQAHLDGAKVLRNLQSQAESLRMAAHQRQRAMMKKLPVKLVLIFSMHLLPVLFVATLLPAFTSLSSL